MNKPPTMIFKEEADIIAEQLQAINFEFKNLSSEISNLIEKIDYMKWSLVRWMFLLSVLQIVVIILILEILT